MEFRPRYQTPKEADRTPLIEEVEKQALGLRSQDSFDAMLQEGINEAVAAHVATPVVDPLIENFAVVEDGDPLPPLAKSDRWRQEPAPVERGIFEGKREKNYEFVRLLGQGGMGQVWLANDLNTCYDLDGKRECRQVVIKAILPEVAILSERYQQRFEREQQMMVHADSDFVVRPLDAYVSEQGHPRLVMQYQEGGSLYHALEQQKKQSQTPEAAMQYTAAIAWQVAEALRYMSERGVVHRDLKPDNILLNNGVFPTFPKVSVADFGLAFLGEQPLSGSPRESGDYVFDSTHDTLPPSSSPITQQGTVVGTPKYMAPELWYAEKAHTGTDLYALGIMMYELVTKQEPYPPSKQVDPAAMMYRDYIPPHEALGLSKPTPFTLLIETLMDEDPTERQMLMYNAEGCRVRLVDTDDYSNLTHVPLKTPREVQEAIVRMMITEYPDLANTEPFSFDPLVKEMQRHKWEAAFAQQAPVVPEASKGKGSWWQRVKRMFS